MSSKREFHHPYEPYDIQLEFMGALYECIKQKKVGIFESPTGTGKSLSLICGSLTWLRDHQLDVLGTGETDDPDEPEWVVAHAKAAKRELFLDGKQKLQARLQRIREKEARQEKRYETGEAFPKRQRMTDITTPMRIEEHDEEAFLLEDYQSDGESIVSRCEPNTEIGLSEKSMELAIKIGLAPKITESKDDETEDSVKIFFCSRTHSQLIQFANEVRRVKIPLADVGRSGSENKLVEEIKHLSLGSRKNLCINKDVKRLSSTMAINERCLELQKSKESSKKCKFLPKKENETLVHQFRDHALAEIRDIEDLGTLGGRIGICPYYAARAAIKPSEIVTLPYPLLLQKSAREALEISLKDHVVIIDEAHNLMDAIAGIYSVKISLGQLNKARVQLTVYLQRFRNRLKGKNRVYVAQTVRLLDSLSSYLRDLHAKSNVNHEGIVKRSDLLTGKGTDQINLYKLSQYLQDSKLARKVDDYAMFVEEQQKSKAQTSPVLISCQSFFQALTYPDKEGRFFWSRDDDDISLKYLLLDPTNHFKEIVDEARSVILAGGTMSPMEDYFQQLFPYLDPERIMTLSCGHVIPAENLIAVPMSATRSAVELDFTFDRRNNPGIIDGLGETIIELTSVIPDGVVIFFPSYAYLDSVLTRWKRPGKGSDSIFERLQVQKTVLHESKAEASVIEDILERYSALIHSPTETRGAILLSVVGGTLSEGINFSDKLGRGVLIVGLPFPNLKSVEWQAKLSYIEQQSISRGSSQSEAQNVSRTFYENACMRAVNQCIGRAIRHKEDYGAIFLLDRRYSTQRIQSKLPGWIQKGIVQGADKLSFAQIKDRAKAFFDSKRDHL